MYFTPYIDGNGVHIPSYEDRLESLLSSYRNIFGPEINLTPSSPDYQLLSVFAKALDDLSQIILVDFASRNPQYASGVGLDLLLPLHGLVRGGATYSTVVLQLSGMPNAVLSVPNETSCIVLENNGDAADARDIPGHSICVLFADGNAYAVAQKVFDKKAPGIGTYGNLTLPVTDGFGQSHEAKLQRITSANVALTIELSVLDGYDITVPDRIRDALVAWSATLEVGQALVVSSLYSVVYGAVSSEKPLFAIRLLTATYGGTTTSDILTVAWNQKVNLRAAQIQIVETA